jgi:hypothetical protein
MHTAYSLKALSMFAALKPYNNLGQVQQAEVTLVKRINQFKYLTLR